MKKKKLTKKKDKQLKSQILRSKYFRSIGIDPSRYLFTEDDIRSVNDRMVELAKSACKGHKEQSPSMTITFSAKDFNQAWKGVAKVKN